MDSWKTLIIAALVMLGSQVLADENKGSYDRSILLILLSPTFLVSGTTELSELGFGRNPEKPICVPRELRFCRVSSYLRKGIL
ncbi:hypothetical protein PsexTeo8_39690 [Pseudomonas extremaustralis]|nr:hypothetical protein [Pseudomonas extremaustralis]